MLRRIGLQNFKCWRELDIELAPITLFFGVNSSGKTAILESLLMLKQTVASRDPNTHLNFGGGPRDYADLGSYSDLAFGHDENQPIGMNLDWDSATNVVFKRPRVYVRTTPGPGITLEHSVSWRWDDDVIVDHLGYSACGNERFDCFIRLERREPDNYRVDHSDSLQTMYAYIDVDGESIDEIYDPDPIPDSPSNCYLLPLNIRLGEIKAGNHSYEPQFERAFEKLMEKIRYLGPLRQYPQRYYTWTGERKREVVEPDGSDAFAVLVSSERVNGDLKQEVANWLQKLDLIQNMRIIPAGQQSRFYEVMVTVAETESSLLDVGFGVSQVLPVITKLLSTPEKSIILLEQPELHLHPNAQAALADLLLYVAEERNLQLIVESHSEHIVRRLQRRIAEAAPAFATPENVKMYYCQPGQAGSTIEQVDLDRFGQISNWPDRFFGDVSGDLHTMLKAALERRSQERERVGSGG